MPFGIRGALAPRNCHGQSMHVNRYGRVSGVHHSRPHRVHCHRPIYNPFFSRPYFFTPRPVVCLSTPVIRSSPAVVVQPAPVTLTDRTVKAANIGMIIFGIAAMVVGVAMVIFGSATANFGVALGGGILATIGFAATFLQDGSIQ